MKFFAKNINWREPILKKRTALCKLENEEILQKAEPYYIKFTNKEIS